MMQIQTITIDLTERDTTAIETWLASAITQPIDDVPLAHDHAELATIVGRSPVTIFRIEDDPYVLGVWQRMNFTAVVFTLWKRSLQCIDVLLLGASTSLPPIVSSVLSASEIESLEYQQGRPTLAHFVVRQSGATLADLLGFIAYMPVWCEVNALE
jgi:hypothetical protein